MFHVEKTSGKIEARPCTNNSKQQEWINSGDEASPTVATNSVMLTATIKAEDPGCAATHAQHSEPIHSNSCRDKKENHGDQIIMKICRAMIDTILETDENCQNCVTHENGKQTHVDDTKVKPH